MAGAFVTNDLATMFDEDEFAVAASWTPAAGGAATPGSVHFDQPGTDLLDEVMSQEITVRYPTSVWPTVKESDQIVVGGTPYRVRHVMPLNDGSTTQASLRRD